MGQKTVQRCIF